MLRGHLHPCLHGCCPNNIQIVLSQKTFTWIFYTSFVITWRSLHRVLNYGYTHLKDECKRNVNIFITSLSTVFYMLECILAVWIEIIRCISYDLRGNFFKIIQNDIKKSITAHHPKTANPTDFDRRSTYSSVAYR